MPRKLDDFDNFSGFTGGGEREKTIALPNNAQVTVRSFAWVNEYGGRSGRA